MRLSRNTHLDPNLVTAVKHLFQWANEEGLRGNIVCDLTIKPLIDGDDPFDPIANTIMVNCLVKKKDDQLNEPLE